MSERNYLLLLGDLKDAILKIETFTGGLDYEQYVSNEMVKDAVYRNFEVIGEAAARFSKEFQDIHPQIDWRMLKNFRNVLIHRYFEVDNAIVWHIIEVELHDIKESVQHIIETESE